MIGLGSDENNTISMVYISSVAKSCFMFSSCFQIELVNSKQLECLLKMFFSIQSERGPEKQEQGVCSSEVPPKSVKTSYQGQLFSDQYFETLVSNLSPFFAYFLHLIANIVLLLHLANLAPSPGQSAATRGPRRYLAEIVEVRKNSGPEEDICINSRL